MSESNIKTADDGWRGLYRVGGIAPLVTLVFYLSEAILIPWDSYPQTAEEWFRLFGESKLLGLFYLNALDIVSVTLLALLFLALYVALRRDGQSSMAIAAVLAFVGIAAFVATRTAMVSATLSLNDRYAAAMTSVERSQAATALLALNSIGQATSQTFGFLLTAVAVTIASFVMLRGKTFGKATAYAGIMAGVLTLAGDISAILLPALANLLLFIGMPVWVVWWIMIARGLLQLGGVAARGRPAGGA
jgi:hypothetical protein